MYPRVRRQIGNAVPPPAAAVIVEAQPRRSARPASGLGRRRSLRLLVGFPAVFDSAEPRKAASGQ